MKFILNILLIQCVYSKSQQFQNQFVVDLFVS